MDLKLSGKHVCITGAAGDIGTPPETLQSTSIVTRVLTRKSFGLGLQLAKSYLAQGCKVTLHIHKNKNDELEALLKSTTNAQVIQAAAEDEGAVIASVAEAVKHFGPIHILVVRVFLNM